MVGYEDENKDWHIAGKIKATNFEKHKTDSQYQEQILSSMKPKC